VIARADQALYVAKNSGRNRVEVFSVKANADENKRKRINSAQHTAEVR
jgi:predicted signal transduction protein with EAL and GGDEF domain